MSPHLTISVTIPLDAGESRSSRWRKAAIALRRAADDAGYRRLYDTTEVAGDRATFEGDLKWSVAVEGDV